MIRRRAAGVCAALAACAALGACGGSERPRNVVLITLDTTRRDALGCYGAPAGITPHLDALAAESLVYDLARTVAPITLPAHASILTGLYPPRHGVRDNSLTPLSEDASTLAERLQAAGYETGAFVAAVVLDSAYGLDQGFDRYDQPGGCVSTEKRYAERSGAEVVAAATSWLEARDRERPYLLWVHLFDPHGPYRPPREHLARAGGDPYLGDVAVMDDAVGVLLAALRDEPDWDKTLVIVTGDHGEGRGDHGEETHSSFVYDSTLRIPFFLRHPDGYRAGERSDEIVSVADVFPTVIEALELGSPGDVDGTSLYQRSVPADRGVYFESYHGLLYFRWSTVAGWADADGKYVHSSAPEFYDPRLDPAETTNVLDGRAERYREHLRRIAARPALAPAAEGVDRSILPDLHALGYSGSAGGGELPDPLDAGDGPSPHSRADELRRVMVARFHANRMEYDAAIRLLDEVLASNPKNHEALNRKGGYLIAAGRHAEALGPLKRFTEIGPEWPNVWFNYALALRQTGAAAECLAWLKKTITIDPRNRRALDLIIKLLEDDGRYGDAAPYHALRLKLARG